MNTKNHQGKVKVVNAVASIHKIFDEIAPKGVMFCSMQTTENQVSFKFISNGVEAVMTVMKGGKE